MFMLNRRSKSLRLPSEPDPILRAHHKSPAKQAFYFHRAGVDVRPRSQRRLCGRLRALRAHRLLCIAGVMSYMSALQYQTDVQSAADAAALATATTLNSNPNANAKQVATNYFKANAPSSVNSTGLSVYTGDNAGASTISAQVGYHGNAPALLAGSGTLGMFSNSNGVSSLTINAMGAAHVTAGSSTGGSSSSSSSSSSSGGTSTSSSTNTACANNPNGCYLEMGSSDMVGLAGTLILPSPLGADASLTSVANNNSCVPGNWYNLVSDAGFEINATCSSSPYYGGKPYFSGITIIENLKGVSTPPLHASRRRLIPQSPRSIPPRRISLSTQRPLGSAASRSTASIMRRRPGATHRPKAGRARQPRRYRVLAGLSRRQRQRREANDVNLP